MKIDGSNITIKNISKPELVGKNTTIIRSTSSSGGAYVFMYENNDGTRYPLYIKPHNNADEGNNNYNVIYPSTDLGQGDTLTLDIILDSTTRELARTKKVIVIYIGRIGEEKGVSVCTADVSIGLVASRN